MGTLLERDTKEKRLWQGVSLRPGSPLCAIVSRILAVLFPIVVLLAVTWMMAGLKPFYTYQFDRNGIANITGIQERDIPVVIEALSEYVVGKRDSMQVTLVIKGLKEPIYGQRELDHMVDVRHIFDALRYFVLGYLGLIVLFFTLERKRLIQRLHQFARYGLYGTLLIVSVLGILVMLDFTKYFYAFHEIFFTNDLWLLDPSTDILIQMLPEVFFRDIAVAILVLSLALQWLIKIISSQLLRLELKLNAGLHKGDTLC